MKTPLRTHSILALIFLVGASGRSPLAAQHAVADVAARVDELIVEYNRADAPGGVIGVVQGGELVFAKGIITQSYEVGW